MAPDNEQGYPELPAVGSEVATLLGSLERQRATLAWKCADLDAAGLQASLRPSMVTLGGRSSTLPTWKTSTSRETWSGRDLPAPWNDVDWTTEKGWEWRTASENTPDELHALWGKAVARSRSAVTEALADGGADRRPATTSSPTRSSVTSRRMRPRAHRCRSRAPTRQPVRGSYGAGESGPMVGNTLFSVRDR
jgi:hypothetical protein